jgi:hypothetical protein
MRNRYQPRGCAQRAIMPQSDIYLIALSQAGVSAIDRISSRRRRRWRQEEKESPCGAEGEEARLRRGFKMLLSFQGFSSLKPSFFATHYPRIRCAVLECSKTLPKSTLFGRPSTRGVTGTSWNDRFASEDFPRCDSGNRDPILDVLPTHIKKQLEYTPTAGSCQAEIFRIFNKIVPPGRELAVNASPEASETRQLRRFLCIRAASASAQDLPAMPQGPLRARPPAR